MRAYELMEDLDNALQQFANQIKNDLGMKEFRLHMSRGDISLDMIIVGKDKRNEGVGTEAIKRLTRFADQHNKRIILSPAGKSRNRLFKFYKRFGFHENKGRNKDFSVSDSMIREPEQKITEAKNTGFQIFIDMDGVIADFQKGATDFMADPRWGKNYVIHNYTMGHGKQSNAFWAKLAHVIKIDPEEAVDVWADLDWMPDGKRLWDYVRKYNPIILSSPGTQSREIIEAGKKKWIEKHLKPQPKYIFMVDKWEMAMGKPGLQNILIDDSKKKIDPWIEAGGIGIHHKDTASTIKELKQWGL